MISEVLRNIAEHYFREGGSADLLVDEFNHGPQFVLGQQRGHQDAYAILLGSADYYEELETAR